MGGQIYKRLNYSLIHRDNHQLGVHQNVAYAPTDGINIVGQTTGTDNWIWYAVQYDNQTLWVRSDLLNTFTTLNNQPLDLTTLPTIDPNVGFSGNTEFSNSEWEIELIQGSGIFGGQVV